MGRKTFEVSVSRRIDYTETAYIEVEAFTSEEAGEIALEVASMEPHRFENYLYDEEPPMWVDEITETDS